VHDRRVRRQRFRLLAQGSFEVAATSNHTLNQRIVTFNAIEHEIVIHRECPQVGSKIVTPAVGARILTEQQEPSVDGFEEAAEDRCANSCNLRNRPIPQRFSPPSSVFFSSRQSSRLSPRRERCRGGRPAATDAALPRVGRCCLGGLRPHRDICSATGHRRPLRQRRGAASVATVASS
jgi:hypothetical protein